MREFRSRLIRDYAGDFYAQQQGDTAKIRRYANLLMLTAEAYTVSYGYQAPRHLITTHIRNHRSFAKRFQAGLNGLANKIDLGTTYREIILDAFFWMGLSKVGYFDEGYVTPDQDPAMAPALPRVMRVSPDDVVFDSGARNWRECGFIGDRYRMCLEDVRNSPRFDPEAVKLITPESAMDRSSDGTNASDITREQLNSMMGEYEDKVDLCDIFIARERKILTFQVDRSFEIKNPTRPLAVVDWEHGGAMGPYEVLSLADVPDNVLPTSIAGNVRGLDSLFNGLLLKMAQRAKRQKQIAAYQGEEGDARRATDAGDCEVIRMENPDSIKTITLGAVDGPLMGFALQALDLFKQQAGNPELMLGMAAASGTATQDVLIAQQANKREAAVQQRIARFFSRNAERLCEMMWDDPLLTVQGQERVGDTRFTVDSSWYPPKFLPRAGTFADYQCKIEPYSNEFKSPGKRSQELSAVVAELMQFLPLLQQQGQQFNAQKLLEIKAEYHDLPELNELFEAAPLQEPGAEGEVSPPSAATPNQPREYIRRNVASPTGRQSSLMDLMASGAGSDE